MQYIRCTEFPETFQEDTVYFKLGEANESDIPRRLSIAVVGSDVSDMCYLDMSHLIADGELTGSELVYSIDKTLTLLAEKVTAVEGYGLSQENYSSAEKGKLAGIAAAATANDSNASLRDRTTHTGVQAISTVTGLQAALDAKVAVEAGKGLSSNDFTTSEKNKLAGLESSKFKGLYATLAALQTAHPTSVAGAYADVDPGTGTDVARYIYDANDAKWVAQSGAVAPLTSANVKSLYEANANTNAFTDAEKTKLAGIAASANNYAHPTGDGNSHVPATGTSNSGKALVAGSSANSASWVTLTTEHINGLVAALSGKLDSTHASVTNAREWTAPTATNAEAVAASGTTRLAWTVTRLRELCQAWWNSTAMATKLNGIAEGANNYTLPNAGSTVVGGVKMRLDGTTLYITNDGTNP